MTGVTQDVLIFDMSNEVLGSGMVDDTGRSWGEDALIWRRSDAADSSSGDLIGERRDEIAIGPKFKTGGICEV